MSIKMKQTLVHLFLWTVVLILFITVFLSEGTIANWGDNRVKTIMFAVIVFIGFGGDTLTRAIFKKRKGKIIKDERDDSISLRSMTISAIITFIYIFIVAISLYTKYENSGSVPVAWVWFMAYSMVMVVNITCSATAFILYWKSEKE